MQCGGGEDDDDDEDDDDGGCGGLFCSGVPAPLLTADMKASMWASCCGLLNDLIGSGAVQSHQAGFGGGAGPFRFAPGAGFTPYPSTSSAQSASSSAPTNGSVCKACGLAFSVLRRKYVCSDCGRSFCALCCVLQEELRRCCVCHLLWATAFERAGLMRLRVRDLRRYLTLRDISTDACTEKDELVDLVLRHTGVELQEEEEGPEEGEGPEEEGPEEEGPEEEPEEEGPEETETTPVNAAQPTPLQPALPDSAPQEDTPSSETHSGTREDVGDVSSVSLVPLDWSEGVQVSGVAGDQRPPVADRRASLSDLSGEGEIPSLSVRQLKEILARNFVSFSGCCEKWELVERVHRLYRDHLHNNHDRVAPLGVAPLGVADENMCRICMDAVIDCVLLECGHMITCTKCGKKMNECPICRQYVVRSVHVFRS